MQHLSGGCSMLQGGACMGAAVGLAVLLQALRGQQLLHMAGNDLLHHLAWRLTLCFLQVRETGKGSRL